jgi:low affinity Fe/Cu permease
MSHALERLARWVADAAGRSPVFAAAVLVVLVWLITGPLFDYSDTWQLVINTGTTIVTFLMVFLIQRSQNKESRAIQLKLNEIVAALDGASNRLVDVEELTEDELIALTDHYRALVKLAKQDQNLTESHSVEEAEARHHEKSSKSGRLRRVRRAPMLARRRQGPRDGDPIVKRSRP